LIQQNLADSVVSPLISYDGLSLFSAIVSSFIELLTVSFLASISMNDERNALHLSYGLGHSD
jgi:hypothetical protein